jgi:hypothetical protein
MDSQDEEMDTASLQVRVEMGLRNRGMERRDGMRERQRRMMVSRKMPTARPTLRRMMMMK